MAACLVLSAQQTEALTHPCCPMAWEGPRGARARQAPPAVPPRPSGTSHALPPIRRPGLLLLGSVMRTLAHTVSEGWHCFGVQWLELVVSVQSWHHRP